VIQIKTNKQQVHLYTNNKHYYSVNSLVLVPHLPPASGTCNYPHTYDISCKGTMPVSNTRQDTLRL